MKGDRSTTTEYDFLYYRYISIVGIVCVLLRVDGPY